MNSKFRWIYVWMWLLVGNLYSCKENNELGESIFDTTERERNDFDRWILNNYVYPYNIDFKYRMEDIESSMQYHLVPAEVDKSIKLAKLVKHLWLEAYDEVAGIHFTRAYVPKVIHLVGSPAYENNGSMLLGTAEGGMKVTLYMVNSLRMEADFLNYFYFRTMHHEFTHILNQQKNYDVDFEKISEGNYIQGNWSQVSDEYAASFGFVSPYACSEPREDFAEVLSTYVTYTQNDWDALLIYAGTNGAAIMNQKFEMVKNYMKNSWKIDLTELRDVVQRRSGEIELLDLDNL